MTPLPPFAGGSPVSPERESRPAPRPEPGLDAVSFLSALAAVLDGGTAGRSSSAVASDGSGSSESEGASETTDSGESGQLGSRRVDPTASGATATGGDDFARPRGAASTTPSVVSARPAGTASATSRVANPPERGAAIATGFVAKQRPTTVVPVPLADASNQAPEPSATPPGPSVKAAGPTVPAADAPDLRIDAPVAPVHGPLSRVDAASPSVPAADATDSGVDASFAPAHGSQSRVNGSVPAVPVTAPRADAEPSRVGGSVPAVHDSAPPAEASSERPTEGVDPPSDGRTAPGRDSELPGSDALAVAPRLSAPNRGAADASNSTHTGSSSAVDGATGPDAAGAATPVASIPSVAETAPAPSATDRDLDRVHPELRARLERVVARMEREHGHEVTVVEGWRSRERQQALYAQGRTRPGPVVTWTRSSLHTEGRAVDVQVDGGWNDRTAYARLQRIAREEGLGTLGMRDPGHLQWTADEAQGGRRAGATRDSATTPVPGARVAPSEGTDLAARDSNRPVSVRDARADVADTGRVARAARVASVARVAPVARPGRSAPIESSRRITRDAKSPPAAPPDTPDAAIEGTDRSVRTPFAAPTAPTQGFVPAVDGAPLTAVRGSGAVDAMGRVLEVQDALAAGPSGSSVRLTGLGSGIDAVRVGLLDRRVSADMDLTDPAAARRLRARVGELHRALEGQGFDPGRMAVNAAVATDGGAEAWTGPRNDQAAEALKALLGGTLGREERAPGTPSPGTERNSQGRDGREHRPDRSRDESSRRQDR